MGMAGEGVAVRRAGPQKAPSEGTERPTRRHRVREGRASWELWPRTGLGCGAERPSLSRGDLEERPLQKSPSPGPGWIGEAGWGRRIFWQGQQKVGRSWWRRSGSGVLQKGTGSQVLVHPPPTSQFSARPSLNPKGATVWKGPGQAEREGGGCLEGCGQVPGGGVWLEELGGVGTWARGPHSLVSTAPTASVQTSTPGAHFTVLVFCGEHPSSAFCTQL